MPLKRRTSKYWNDPNTDHKEFWRQPMPVTKDGYVDFDKFFRDNYADRISTTTTPVQRIHTLPSAAHIKPRRLSRNY